MVLGFELVTHLDHSRLYLLLIQLQNLKLTSLRIDAGEQAPVVQEGHLNHEHGLSKSELGPLVYDLPFIVLRYLRYLLKTIFFMIQFNRYIPEVLPHLGHEHVERCFSICYFLLLYLYNCWKKRDALVLPHCSFVRLRSLLWYA